MAALSPFDGRQPNPLPPEDVRLHRLDGGVISRRQRRPDLAVDVP